MTVSVVIPTRDKAPRLRLTMAALAAQRTSCRWEVVVVDDGSNDETGAVLATEARNLPLRVVHGAGGGRAEARNRGARDAVGELLIFLDDDILVGPDFIMAHVQANRAAPGLVHGRLREMVGVTRLHDPAVGTMGARPIDAVSLRAGTWTAEGCRLAVSALERAVEAMFAGDLPVNAPWLAGAGANLSLPRAEWDAVGGYDAAFSQRWGCEDLEFAFRLHRRRVAFTFSVEAGGIHLSHANLRRWQDHDENLARFIRLHPCPEVAALGALLGPTGSPQAYARAVAELVAASTSAM